MSGSTRRSATSPARSSGRSAGGEPERWRDYWQSADTRLVHFIGKDNIPFHCIVFPACCMAKNEGAREQYVLAENVPANEFYNLEGRQFSKSEGWYVDLDDFFSKYQVDAIRYTLCANMPEKKDSEFTWHDFMLRNNSELADIFGNLANRVFRFIEKNFDGCVPALAATDDEDRALLALSDALPERVAALLDTFEFRKALFEWIDLARAGNKFFDTKAPWKTVKTDKALCGTTLHVCLRALQSLAVVGAPFLPETAQRLWVMLGRDGEVEKENWSASPKRELAAGAKLGEPAILFTKIEPERIESEVARLKKWAEEAHAKQKKPAAGTPAAYTPVKETVSYDDFAKLDFRVAKILEAEAVPKSKKLIRVQIDLGFEKRQIVAGVALHFKPEDLVGRTIVTVANLQPAKIMGVESQGMLLAAHDGDALMLITSDASPGSSIS
ncbi:MAG: methionine--tRNA ligase subunit beta [Deltaproteobacteria bacterium]|nr:methionine--tRNA ligase subunit beta [Deltaproteobacteria bacterium]